MNGYQTPVSAIVLSLLTTLPIFADTEPWADSKLPVRDGLTLWLDAGRAAGDKILPKDGKLTEWRDASGKGRHLRQESDVARPLLVSGSGGTLVRFDGLGTYLRAVKQGSELHSFTLFVVGVPRQNVGGFQGIMAFNATGGKDYTTGMNVDFGPLGTPRFSFLNIEGRGLGGVHNMRTGETPFGRLHTLEILSDIAAKNLRLFVDGKLEGDRPRDPVGINMEEITLGARCYPDEDGGKEQVRNFSRCDIAEVLVYDRALTADEATKVRAYLTVKYNALKEDLPPDGATELLKAVKDPPPVQMFVPGFTVREIPVDLTNINNVKYRQDGTLVALGYDGKIWLLRDTDGDGLEDKAELFWDNKTGLVAPIGMDLTPPGYKHGDGVFVIGKTRLVLIVDTDKDDKGDKEIVIVDNWKVGRQDVDGLGVVIDPKDQSIYFGRGTTYYAEPYLLDKEGKAHYSPKNENGTIMKVSPDLKSREIVCTGIRFPVALRINREGDLFATDQEGATWVPNGNPLDELLHIQKGRHYGFPPRHPKHNPDVIDEPSTFDYGPQHQCTCGLNFNEPVKKDGPIVGPKEWAGDAFVTGYSRGKLYRTQLVKSAAGYVARTHLIACLNMLTVDACVSPDGGLVVACHSGGPDWGTGPKGKGKLYKITFTDREHPQPVFVWPSGPREVRVEFDRPVDPRLLQNIVKEGKLTAGLYVGAGDRFESLWPGYAVVQRQKITPRNNIPIRSAQLTPDRRSIVLATDANVAAVRYAFELPGMGRPSIIKTAKGVLAQHPAVDLEYDLSGCEATWTSADGSAVWTGWLPHLDLKVARALTAGSAPHDALWKAMEKPGELRLKAQLDLIDMLRPAVQPGSHIDYEWPTEIVTVAFRSNAPLQMTSSVLKADGSGKDNAASFTLRAERNKPVGLELRMKSDGGPVSLDVHWTTNEDKRPRPLQLHRILVPWADKSGKDLDQLAKLPPAKELEGGSWGRGRQIFFSEQAQCSKCHTLSGRGGEIGPDLSNLVHRDYSSVLRDITFPSFAINPDHVTYTVNLKNGRTLSGVVRNVDNKVRIGDIKGIVTEVERSDVEEMTPSSVSTMPEGMPKQLGPERMRDLMTFLLTSPPQMPRDNPGPRPKLRTLAEVNAALAGAPEPPAKTRPLRIVLVAGPQDHGPGEHDYPAWQKMWAELMKAAENVEIKTAWEWPAKEEFQKADVMVFYQRGDWDARRAADIDAYIERGGGLVYIHWAVDGRKAGPEFAKRIGLAVGEAIAYRHGPVALALNQGAKHPVLRNFDKLNLIDETYWKLVGKLPKDRVLGTAVEDGQVQPQLWSLEHGQGRVFVSIPGHYSWTFDDPLFRVILLRAIAWSAREPVDRFNELVWPGADVAR